MKTSKKLFSVLICLAMILTCCTGFSAGTVKAAETTQTKDSWVDPGNYTRGWYDVVTDLDIYGNKGTEEDPYEIKNAKDFAGLSYYSNIIANDNATTDFGGKFIEIKVKKIDLSAHYWYPIGAIQNFKGVVEGNGVVIKNMYIGNESKYETCGKIGLFGSIFANVKNIAVKNAKIYSNSTYASGFAAYWLGGNIENCSVEGTIYQIASSSNAGGFIGYHSTAGCTVKNCFAQVSIIAPNATSSNIGGFIGNTTTATNYAQCHATGNTSITSGNIGGFAGYCNGASFTDCLARGNVSARGSANAGGFIGNSENGIQKQCAANGNVKAASGNTNAGGFIGAIRKNSAYNSYSTGNAEAGSNAGGFIGLAWNYAETVLYQHYDGIYANTNELLYQVSKQRYSVSMTIENCYAAGSAKAGTGGTVAGFFGGRQYDYSAITFKKCYWNLSAKQVLDGTYRSNDAKLAVAYTSSRTVVGTYENYMKSKDFVADLNEYVYQNSDSYNSWTIEADVNGGYPYVSSNKQSLFISGDTTEIPVNSGENSESINVYGTVIFPEVQTSEKPDTPEEPDDNTISAGLKWGSLEYVYTAGEYNKETKEYADGSWAPKEEGVSDLITITNQTDVDIQASYEFLASTEGSGNYVNLTGEFVQEDKETVITSPVIVRSKQGDINGIQKVFLKINGVPVNQVNVDVPEVIGSVAVTVSKYKTAEPEQPEPSEEAPETSTPSGTKEPSEQPVTTASAPTPSEEVKTSENPIISEQPEASAAPEESQSPVTEEVPQTEDTPVTTKEETPERSESPVSSELPETQTPETT